jgi:cellobiose phosphorylase
MYQAAVEGLLGLRRRGHTLSISPCIPSMWPGFQVTWRFGQTMYHITVTNTDHRGVGVRSVTVDGKRLADDGVPLADDGRRHEVVVELGVPLAATT